MDMTAILILPGLFGSGQGHWQQHWLADRPEAELLEQDDWERPRLDSWMAKLEAALERRREVYLVAHSLGCVLAAHLAGRPLASRVKGALLVAPCDLSPTEKLHPDRLAFGTMPTAALPFASVTIGSLNDHYMSLDRLTLFSRLWKTDLRNIGLAGHINVASGFGRWPGGYAFFDALRARVDRPERKPAAAARRNAPAFSTF